MDIELLNWFCTYIPLLPEGNIFTSDPNGYEFFVEFCKIDNDNVRLNLFSEHKEMIGQIKESVLSICPGLPPELQ